ncbi:MAG TPA: enoyl-CoA hydratase/isomerase family protein [Allosphingosinicella sp.]|jgi:enoyl-CoA hydratase/carnithine racemase
MSGRLLFFEDKRVAARHEAAMFDLRLQNGIARLILRRPDARNAIPADQWRPLGALAQGAAAEGARLLILEGEGKAFCAGADLKDFERMHGDLGAASEFRQAMREGIEAVAGLTIPTVAAIHGPCFGAGVALAMACDLRFAGSGASFAITPAKYGISYPQEDVARLVALVGRGQAARLLLSAGTIDAEEALRIGLADLPLDQLDAFVAAMARNSAASFATLKRGIELAAAGVARDEAQDSRFDDLIAGDELAEALAALRARR